MNRSMATLLACAALAGPALAADAAAPVTDAPSRGKVPMLSPYRTTLPDLYQLDKAPVEQIGAGITRQTIHGAQTTFARWVFAKGTVVPLHHHVYEQVTWIVSGSAEVYSQGKRYLLRAGDVMVFPPNVPHEFHMLEDTVDIDFFAPSRQDWIEGTFRIYDKK